jgi:glycosyltransferase involved in cell wall biosynthesis
MVSHRGTGLLVGAGCPEEIASAVEWLCRSESDRASMVDRARRLVDERYSRAASAARFSELFRDLLAATRSAG